MEDDGTVNTKKELTAGIGSDTADSVPAESVSLATIVSEIDVKDGGGATENAPVLGWGNKSADLKDLLPQQKTRFMKLDVSRAPKETATSKGERHHYRRFLFVPFFTPHSFLTLEIRAESATDGRRRHGECEKGASERRGIRW